MEAIVRLTAFSGIFIILAFLETIAPRRKLSVSKLWRWSTNLSMTILNIVLIRIIFGAVLVRTAIAVQENGSGFLNYLESPYWFEFAAAIIFLDFMIYLQHLIAHALPIFWRFHLVHHTDLDFDVTTAARFHPVEIIVSLIFKLGLVMVSGASPASVLVFEIILNGSAQFNHSNLKLSDGFDRLLRKTLITPDFHRVHHSIKPEETDSNYGFFLPCWDYLCGTYRAQPSLPHTEMTIGLKEFRGKEGLSFYSLIKLPFILSTAMTGRTDQK